jgi:phosphoribosyl-ATP pyrophosphohydrolase/phosphoribosyl-AMP cyclohydrolase
VIELDFDKLGGLLPAVVQDADSKAVLMLGFMDREAFATTLRSGRATFFSRGRRRLWTKGETSGNVAEVVSISADCDGDTLLLRVRMKGDGRICHRGTVSCFSRELDWFRPVAPVS